MSLIARREFSHLSKEDLARIIDIEERLRTPGGKMPSVPDAKRRIAKLRDALPKADKWESLIRPYIDPILLFLAAIVILFRIFEPSFFSDTTTMIIYFAVCSPFLLLLALKFFDTSRVYGSAHEIKLEIDLLEVFLKGKGGQA